MKNIFSIDIEDWFHILEVKGAPSISAWGKMESRIERNFMNLLDLLDDSGVQATCFFLGWIAERYPGLVKDACKRKHEIASHGYSHQLIYSQSRSDFFSDIDRAKKLLEDLSGCEVIGYRAPGFSITPETIWAFNELRSAGYRYDSSLFPARRGHGYFLEARLHPFRIKNTELYEFPLTVARVLTQKICFFGGGYLRLFPYWLIRAMAEQVAREDRPVIYYVHPREIDCAQPRLPMNWKRKFKSYTNLGSTKPKLLQILAAESMVCFKDFLKEYEDYFTGPEKNVLLG